MLAAAHEHRELVGILFPRTKPIPSLPDWSVEGIVRTMKYIRSKRQAKDSVPVKEYIADWKSQGKEAFVKGDYLAAVHFYGVAMGLDPLDATLFANRSLCWLLQREGELAQIDAQYCRTLCPGWSKAWYREGAALSFLRNYKGAVDAFAEALKLDPANDEIKKAFREATEAMRNAARWSA
ncbi:hypothetical protein QOZ80_5BG0445240 [Eleusine coracana subsp. coracana]|nr:hypothetical protein QOZ80_5BG0445240 [Eleusine coracana subsp. coracana]